MTPSSPSIPRVFRTGWGALALIASILAIQYFGEWYGVGLARLSQEHELERHLGRVARILEPQLNGLNLALSDLELDAGWMGGASASDDDTANPAATFFRANLPAQALERARKAIERAELHRIAIVSASRRTLLDTALEPGQWFDPYEFADLDAPEIESAFTGIAAASLAYQAGGDTHKRYYMPIRETNGGEIRAVLVLMAGRDYLVQLDRLENHFTILMGLSTILLLIVAGGIVRLLQRQRRIERRAEEADRLTSLGTLAAGFAHEIRNPLEIVRAYVEDLERSLRDGDEVEDCIESCRDIVEEVDRMNRLVSQFLSFSRERPTGAPQRARLSTSVTGVLGMLHPAAHRRRVRLEAPADEKGYANWALGIDPDTLKQILMNLILNAVEASPDGATVSVEAEASRSEAVIRVIDEGPGIPPETAQKIFEPFFTTRSTGSGLGLSVSRRLAGETGGSLEHSAGRGGAGTCFTLKLPRQADWRPEETEPEHPRTLS